MKGDPVPASPLTGQTWRVDVAGLAVDLPIVRLTDHLAIALLMVTDAGVTFGTHAGTCLADRLAPLRPDIVVGAATLGIPIAIEVTRALGLDRYVIVQKSPKRHLVDALCEHVSSITSSGPQRLLLDRRAIPLLTGRRVAVVDDVVATGSSLAGVLALVRAAGASVVTVGVVLSEAHAWRQALGPDASLVQALAHIPQFRPSPAGWLLDPRTL